jgi:hypothetical protein
VKSDHAIIFTGKEPPKPHRGEKPAEGERGMRNPIRVTPRKKMDVLDPMSRVHLTRLYTIEHNVGVCNFGQVHKRYLPILLHHFWSGWNLESTSFPTLDQPVSTEDIHHDYSTQSEDPYISLSLLGSGTYGFVDKVESRLHDRTVYARKLFRLHLNRSTREEQIEKIKSELCIA